VIVSCLRRDDIKEDEKQVALPHHTDHIDGIPYGFCNKITGFDQYELNAFIVKYIKHAKDFDHFHPFLCMLNNEIGKVVPCENNKEWTEIGNNNANKDIALYSSHSNICIISNDDATKLVNGEKCSSLDLDHTKNMSNPSSVLNYIVHG